MAARGFIGAGDVYINRIVNGVKQGRQGPYESSKFEIKPNVTKKELKSKGRNTYGQVIESVSVQDPAGFTVDLTEVNKESMIIALLGTEAANTQTAGTLADQAVTIKKGSWVDIGKKALGSAITVENSGGSTTYAEGTDYLLNRPLGWIKVLNESAIADAASLLVSGPYSAVSGAVIRGATNSDIRAEIIFDGINQADGLPVIVTVYEAIIAADSAFDFLADDFNTVSLPGTMKTPTGKTEPFTVELRNAA